MTAWDGSLNSASNVGVSFNILAVEDAPSFTTVNNLVATEDTATTITYDQLALAADESDAEGATIQFELVSLESGTLTTNGADAVSIGDMLGPGGQWVWQPPSDANGNDADSFSIRAFDGALASNGTVPVKFDIAPVNDPPTPGGGATLADNTASFTSLNLTWTKATEPSNETPQANLSYCVYRSTSDITTISAAEASTLVGGSCGVDINSIADSGLTPSTDYYYNVVVEDEQGGKSIYNSLYAPTASAFHIVYNDWRTGTDNRLKYARNTTGSLQVDTVFNHNIRIRHVDFDKDDSGDLHILFFDDANNDDLTGTLNYLSGSVAGGFTNERITETQEMREGSDISVEGDGTVHIIYNEEWSTGNQEHTLFYTTGTPGLLSAPELVTTANPTNDQGWGIDSFVDSQGTLHFAYLDEANAAFRYGEGAWGKNHDYAGQLG